ncbi:MAG: hypothetical protein IJU52_09370 [Clostridia bacterium]|nr:hypothetical protein [Clostridia bacterium]
MKTKRDDTAKLYDEIYKNAAMGAGTTKHLLETERGEEMTDSLKKQYAEYRSICRNAEISMRARGGEIKGYGRMKKMMTDRGVSLNLLFDNSDRHVAEMLMNGSTMGVINAEKSTGKYSGAEKEAKELMKHLSDFELSTIENMRRFLS